MLEEDRFPRDGRKMSDVNGSDRNKSYGGIWSIYGRPFSSYMEEFSFVDTDGVVSDVIEAIRKKPNPNVIDLLAPTKTLRDFYYEVRKERPMRGLAVGLTDNRSNLEKLEDEHCGITYLGMDLSQIQNWDAIAEWLGTEKADLVMERGSGGLHFVPTRLQFAHRAIGKIWDMLNPEDGVAMLQIPPADQLQRQRIPITNWLQALDENGVYYQYLDTYESGLDGYQTYGLLMMKKLRDAALPTIDLRMKGL